MLFLITTAFRPPARLVAEHLTALRAAERQRAHALPDEGTLRHLWREPATGAAWGVWEAVDRDAALDAVGSLPAAPYQSIDVHEIVDHPNARAEHSSPQERSVSTTAVVMPALGESVTEATVIRWLKSPGDQVAEGEPLLEAGTDKVDTEVESPVSGRLVAILVDESSTVGIGTEIAQIEVTQTEPTQPEPGRPEPSQPESSQPARSEPVEATAPPEPAVADTVASRFLSPAVRVLQRTHALDLGDVIGSGARGRVTRRDVETMLVEAAPAPAQVASPPAPTPLPGAMTRDTAVVESSSMTAPLTTVVEVDLSGVEAAVADFYRSDADPSVAPLTPFAFVAKSACEALGSHPGRHLGTAPGASATAGHEPVDLGLAVDMPAGPRVALVRAADELTLRALARRIRSASTGQGVSDGPTNVALTLSHSGSRGVLVDTAPLLPAQVAALDLGSVVRRAVVIAQPDGQEVIAVRSMAHLALTYDPARLDSAAAAAFVIRVKSRLESEPFVVLA